MRLAVLALMVAASAAHADGTLLDRVDRALAVRSPDGFFRAEVSGLADLDLYWIDQSPPGLIFGSDDGLLATPRLRLFLDAHLGRRLYAFVQGRLDQGFDPRAYAFDARADEYLLRFSPWADPRLAVQAGKFATVVGSWVARHDSWESPLVTAPLPYEHVTTISDAAAPDRPSALFARRPLADEKSDWVPILWGPGYTSGVAAFGHVRRVDWAMEVKNAAPSSRPEVWGWTARGLYHPTTGARLGVRPGAPWNLGLSFSTGPYLRKEAEASLRPGQAVGDFRQWLVGGDASFAWRHLELWAELFWSRFEMPFPCRTCVPCVGCQRPPSSQDADTAAWYVEGRWRVTPRLWTALRWNQQVFDDVGAFRRGGRAGLAGARPWDGDAWRADAGVGWRFDRHWQVKLQYSWLAQAGPHPEGPQLVAAQATLRF